MGWDLVIIGAVTVILAGLIVRLGWTFEKRLDEQLRENMNSEIKGERRR